MLDYITQKGAPDIALLDICMPGILGTETAKNGMCFSIFSYSALNIITYSANIIKNNADTTDMECQVLSRFADTALVEGCRKRIYTKATGINKIVLIIFRA